MSTPRTVRTEQELDALPNRSYVEGRDGFRHEKQTDGWLLMVRQETRPHGTNGIELPATVLWEPQP